MCLQWLWLCVLSMCLPVIMAVCALHVSASGYGCVCSPSLCQWLWLCVLSMCLPVIMAVCALHVFAQLTKHGNYHPTQARHDLVFYVLWLNVTCNIEWLDLLRANKLGQTHSFCHCFIIWRLIWTFWKIWLTCTEWQIMSPLVDLSGETCKGSVVLGSTELQFCIPCINSSPHFHTIPTWQM